MHGKGVLAGLTNVSDVRAKKIVDGEEVPCAGNLYFVDIILRIWYRAFESGPIWV